MCCTPLCVNKHKEGKQYLSPPTLCVNKHKEGKQDLSPPTICVNKHKEGTLESSYTMCKQTQRR